MSEWISVDDRLPINTPDEMGDSNYIVIDVIVTNGKRVWHSLFKAGNVNSFWKEFDCNLKVTHWMPLPLPPKE